MNGDMMNDGNAPVDERAVPTRKRKRRGPKRVGNHFMDAAMDGYIRNITLEKWRVCVDAIEVNGLSLGTALRESGDFPERAAYREIWARWWEERVNAVYPEDRTPGGDEARGGDAASGEEVPHPAPHPIASIEEAVRGALEEESLARETNGAPGIEDTLHYKTFVDAAMDHLLGEAAGEIEEIEDFE